MIDLAPRHLETVKGILAAHVPGCEVRAFGSRASWTAKDYSDLDLAIVGEEPLDRETLSQLQEAFEESDLPMRVDVLDWHAISEGFRKSITSDCVVVQEPASSVNWRDVMLGDYANLTKGLSYKSVYLNQDGPELLGLGQFVPGGGAKLDGGRTYSGEYRDKDVARPGDVLIAMTDLTQRGDVLGSPLIVPRSVGEFCLFTLDAGKIEPSDGLDPQFLYYALRNKDFRGFAAAHATGTTIRRVWPADVLSYEFPLPPLEEQRAIAHVLGTLDDKIELNRRMNATLETMARAVFKDWFVDFGPVRAKLEGREPYLPPEVWSLFPDRLVDSDLGEIPEGWEVKALGTFGEIITGKTPSTKRPEYYGEDIPFLRIPDMHRKMYALKTELMLSDRGAESQPKKTLPPGSVSVSCIATPGLVVLNHRNTQTNQQINSIVPYDQSVSRYLYWICCYLSSDIATGGSGGSVFGNMNKSTFSALHAIHPERIVLRTFDALVSPIHTAILANEEQVHTLAAHRSALLPKLVSGEMRVRGF